MSSITEKAAHVPEPRAAAAPLKFAVLSHVLPPSPSGQAVVLYRLLKDLRPSDYCLLSRHDYGGAKSASEAYPNGDDLPSVKLPARYYHLPPGPQVRGLGRLGLSSVGNSVNFLLQTYHRAKGVADALRAEKCRALLACTGDLADLPAACLASRWSGVPFYVYLFDDYLYQWSHPQQRRIARVVEPFVIKRAAGVVAPNEFLGEEYRRRYQVELSVIHNPYEATNPVEAPAGWPARGGEVRIIYTGAVYEAHYDAFRNLVKAIRQLNRPEVRLHLFTAQPREELEREQITGPVEYHGHVGRARVAEVQRQADILFLPLAFNSPFPEVVRTSAPGKMGEYLASGRPILVHAPADSFVSSYFEEHGCGVVVGREDSSMLAGALESILGDEGLRRGLTEQALARAEIDFSLESARSKFIKLLQPDG